MGNTREGLHIVSASISNFQNISMREIEAGGRSFFIVGPNNSDKSSTMRALMSHADSKYKPIEPIKNGETRGEVTMVIEGTVDGNPETYYINTTYTPGKKTGKLVIKNAKRETISAPTKFLEKLVNSISFNPMSFVNASMADKVSMLKMISGVNFDDLNKKEADLIDDRKIAKAKKAELAAATKEHEFSEEDIRVYSEKKPEDEARKNIEELDANLSRYNGVINKINAQKELKPKLEEQISDKESLIADLKKKLKDEEDALKELERNLVATNDNIEKGNEWMSKNKAPSVSDAQKALDLIIAHNAMVDKIETFRNKKLDLVKIDNKLKGIEEDIKSVRQEKVDRVASSQLPVEGLTFNDDGVFYEDLPLTDTQHNTAKLITIGVEIAMALNPKLKVIFLENASLLDNKNLDKLVRIVDERGYQLIGEIVEHDAEGNESEIRFIEEDIV